MSTLDPKELTLRVERALLAMEKRFGEGLSLRRFATIYDVPEADIAAWLAQFNGGSNDLKPGTVAKMKRKLGIISEASSASRESAAPEVTQSPAQPSTSGQSTAGAGPSEAVPPAPKKRRARKPRPDVSTSGVKASAPWLNRPRRPRANAIAAHRARLEAIARGGKLGAGNGAWYQFAPPWLGSSNPSAETARAFLAWLDANSAPAKPASAAPIAPRKPRKFAGKRRVCRAAPAAVVGVRKRGPRPRGGFAGIRAGLLELVANAQRDYVAAVRVITEGKAMLARIDKLGGVR